MKTVCIIPIKENSERVQGKNFKFLAGKKLYEHIITTAIKAECFDDIYVDTNSDEIKTYALSVGIKVIDRLERLATNSANGNDLLVYHGEILPQYDCYFQMFATAPFLQVSTVKKCYEVLTNSLEYDSCFTALEHHGFFWLNNTPINYRPDILPRSQDLNAVVEETTALYGIKKESLSKYRCRIGKNPYVNFISKFEAVDINTEEDFAIAEYIGKFYWGL
jgi:N-acylneuraminate cytidylyltransferase